MAGPYDYNSGINPNLMRSESTQHEINRRQLRSNPPVTILQDVIGSMTDGGAQNAARTAIRERILQLLLETGAPATSNFGPNDTYGR